MIKTLLLLLIFTASSHISLFGQAPKQEPKKEKVKKSEPKKEVIEEHKDKKAMIKEDKNETGKK